MDLLEAHGYEIVLREQGKRSYMLFANVPGLK